MAHKHTQSSAVVATVDVVPWPMPESEETNGRQTGKNSRHHIWSASWLGRGA